MARSHAQDESVSLRAQLSHGLRALGTWEGLFYATGAVVLMLYRWWGEWMLAEGMIGQSGHTVGWTIYAAGVICVALCTLLDFKRGMSQATQ